MDIKDDISSIRIRLLRMNNWAYKSAVKIAKMNDVQVVTAYKIKIEEMKKEEKIKKENEQKQLDFFDVFGSKVYPA